MAPQEKQRRQSVLNKEASDAREQNKTTTVDAGIAGDWLHVEVEKFSAAACSDPGSVQQGASATRAASVLFSN